MPFFYAIPIFLPIPYRKRFGRNGGAVKNPIGDIFISDPVFYKHIFMIQPYLFFRKGRFSDMFFDMIVPILSVMPFQKALGRYCGLFSLIGNCVHIGRVCRVRRCIFQTVLIYAVVQPYRPYSLSKFP
ncbi:hypothetical protein CGZ65_00525 [Neisseria weixii]|nr:hypothetical protein CGZ65_00525 [Neisseria weixii]